MKKLIYTEVMTIFQRVFILLVVKKIAELEEGQNLEKERVDYEWINVNDWYAN